MKSHRSGLALLDAVVEQPFTPTPRPSEIGLRSLDFFTPANPLIIGFGHKRGSGKDTAGAYLAKHYNAHRVAFADPIKVGAMITYGLTHEQCFGEKKNDVDPFWGTTPGKLQQIEGSDLHRLELAELMPERFGDMDLWVRMAERRINALTNRLFVITDVRFPNEAEKIKKMGGLLVRVDCEFEERMRRLGDDPDNPSRDDSHISETALDGYADWDFILDNNGTLDDLKEGVETILRHAPVEAGLIEPFEAKDEMVDFEPRKKAA
jgi:hypothetical protein